MLPPESSDLAREVAARVHEVTRAMRRTKRFAVVALKMWLPLQGMWLAAASPLIADDVPAELLRLLANVPDSLAHRYRAVDDRGVGLDCLNPTQTKCGRLLGVYHHVHKKRFHLYLGESKDGLHWRQAATLDTNASQGLLHQTSDGLLYLFYEKDAPNSCWIRIRQYRSIDDLLANRVAGEIDLPRSLAPTAEGTPSIESIQTGPDPIRLDLRFHFFQAATVDRLASGTLLASFDRSPAAVQHWKPKESEQLNRQFESLGERGNFGSRDRFRWRTTEFCLQEIQRSPRDWSSWRVYLCSSTGQPLEALTLRTHGGSKAFCNPHAVQLRSEKGPPRLLISYFLPAQGAAKRESGQLLFLAPLAERSPAR